MHIFFAKKFSTFFQISFSNEYPFFPAFPGLLPLSLFHFPFLDIENSPKLKNSKISYDRRGYFGQKTAVF
jgi:hypothetical protein